MLRNKPLYFSYFHICHFIAPQTIIKFMELWLNACSCCIVVLIHFINIWSWSVKLNERDKFDTLFWETFKLNIKKNGLVYRDGDSVWMARWVLLFSTLICNSRTGYKRPFNLVIGDSHNILLCLRFCATSQSVIDFWRGTAIYINQGTGVHVCNLHWGLVREFNPFGWGAGDGWLFILLRQVFLLCTHLIGATEWKKMLLIKEMKKDYLVLGYWV